MTAAVYHRVAAQIRRRIAEGEWAPGQRLTSEGKLGDQLEVGIQTVRRALAVLRDEGIIWTQHGGGTYVADDLDPATLTLDDDDRARMRPTVARTVHYVARGSADGRFPSVCRAAIVTEVGGDDTVIGLVALNPTGFFFHALSDGGVEAHSGYLDDPAAVGARCNVGRRTYPGGTWHYPEPVTD